MPDTDTQTPENTLPDLSAEEIEDRVADMNAILNQYGDGQELDRDNAKLELMKEYGVNPDTKEVVDPATVDLSPPEPEQEKIPGLEAEAETETTEEETGEKEPEKPEDPAEPSEAEALRAQLLERDRTIAELQSKIDVAGSEDEYRAKADEKVRTVNEQIDADATALETKIAEFRENYGDEAAEALKKSEEAALTLRREAAKRDWQAEFDRARDEHARTAAAQNETVVTIRQIPELQSWLDESNRSAAGDATADPTRFNLARTFEEMLQRQPEWQGRPRIDLYREVVSRVKTAMGEQSGTPQTPEQPKSTGERMRDAIRSGQDGVQDGPQTLSDLSGGTSSRVKKETHEMTLADMTALSEDELMTLH